MLKVAILTLFPELFPGPLGASVVGRALEEKRWELAVHHIRDFAEGRHRKVDDTPFGGGAGMVFKPDVLDAAIRHAAASLPEGHRKIYLSPRGAPFTQKTAQAWASSEGLLLICGRYEGVDQRVLDAHAIEEVSLGDFVLAGGEVAAMAMLEAALRLLPGTLGNEATHDEESFTSGLLEYPHYTRPAVWEGRAIPDVLASGHHADVKAWRLEQAEDLTRARRPDLWAAYEATKIEADKGKKKKR